MVWWTPAAASGAARNVVPFEGREDGVFELEGLPEGTVHLLASSAELPRSATVRVDLGTGEEREIVLELPDALRMSGQVVDAESGDPVRGATLQLYTNQGVHYVHARGPPVGVDAEGRFDVSGFAAGQNRYVIEAPGYATLLGDTWAQAPGPVELGRVPLFRSQELTVTLTGELPADLEGFSASAIAARFYDPRPFGPDGSVRFEGVGPGRARVYVEMADGTSTWHMVDLVPGEPWRVDVPVGGGPPLQVLVEPGEPGPLPEGLSASATVLLDNGYHNRTAPLDDDGIARLPGIPPGNVAVDVWNGDGERIGATVGRQTPHGGAVHVRLGGAAISVLVLDRDGRPVHDAEVHLYLPGGKAGWYDYGYTDENGLRTVRGFPADELLAGIVHPDHGKVFGLPVEPARAPDPLVLQFETDAELLVRLREAGAPRPGVQVRVLGGSGTYVVGWLTSDADGLVRIPDLGAGVYDVTVVHPDTWRSHAQVAATKGAEPTPLEVHGLGTLRLRARASGGAPVTGLALELGHVELGVTVEEWIAAGLVDAPAAGLVTDDQGRLRLEGLPRGTYTWRAELADGTLLAGESALFPGAAGVEVIVHVP